MYVEPDNLAGEKTVTGSSQLGEEFSYANVIDGSESESYGQHYWLPDDPYTGWVMIDLGETVPIGRLEILNTHNGSYNNRSTKEWQIELLNASEEVVLTTSGSLDDLNQQENTTIEAETVDLTSATRARFVRFNVLSYWGSGGGLNELRIYRAQYTNTSASQTIRGSDGYLTINNGKLSSGVTIDLSTTTRQSTGSGGRDLISGIDHLIGSRYADTLTGNDNNNTFDGGSGNDTLRGGKGNDFFTGGSGNDKLYGEENNDSIMGETGNDTLSGGSGADILHGGSGNDSLTGGSGNDSLIGDGGTDLLVGGAGNDYLRGGDDADQFKYVQSSEGGDTIGDFTASADTLLFVSGNFGNLAAGSLSSNRFRASSSGTASSTSQRFLFNTTTGVLSYDSDGNGSGSAVTIATLSGVTSLSASRILIVAS